MHHVKLTTLAALAALTLVSAGSALAQQDTLAKIKSTNAVT